jgi:hypothetical protein
MASANNRARIEQKLMRVAGAMMLVSGVFHIIVWSVVGGSMSGDVSWRKPILFGFSTGATMVSLAWVLGKIGRRRGDFVLFSLFSVAMLLEVGLITFQQWRGVASHFNRSTPVDAMVLAWIEALIVFATIVIAEVTRRTFQEVSAGAELVLAIRAGMVLLLFACLLGFVLVGYGNYRMGMEKAPGIYGNAGVMKFPHGMPIHAIQYLPITAWIFRKIGASEQQSLNAVKVMLKSVLAFTLFSMLQTFTGRARFEPWWLSAVVLIAAFGFFAELLTLCVMQLTKRLATGLGRSV